MNNSTTSIQRSKSQVYQYTADKLSERHILNKIHTLIDVGHAYVLLVGGHLSERLIRELQKTLMTDLEKGVCIFPGY